MSSEADATKASLSRAVDALERIRGQLGGTVVEVQAAWNEADMALRLINEYLARGALGKHPR